MIERFKIGKQRTLLVNSNVGNVSSWVDRKDDQTFSQSTEAARPENISGVFGTSPGLFFTDDSTSNDSMVATDGSGDGHLNRNSYTGMMIILCHYNPCLY